MREEADNPTTGPVPVPVRPTVCGLPEALSVIVTEAVRVPGAVGAKVTLRVQLAPVATEVPQVLTWLKSPVFAPVKATLLMLRAALPVFVSVTGCTPLVVPRVWLSKIRLVTVRLTAGPLPVPVRFKLCGLRAALSVIVNTALRVPGAEGVNVTLIAQLAPAATELPHVLVWVKSPGLVPVKVKLVMLKVTFPVLLSVAVCATLVVPTV